MAQSKDSQTLFGALVSASMGRCGGCRLAARSAEALRSAIMTYVQFNGDTTTPLTLIEVASSSCWLFTTDRRTTGASTCVVAPVLEHLCWSTIAARRTGRAACPGCAACPG